MVIRKPPARLLRQDPVVQGLQNLRETATAGTTMVRAAGHYVRGLVCWGLALLWGFAALVAGLGGSVPTFVGVGALALGMGWIGRRSFAKARGCRRA